MPSFRPPCSLAVFGTKSIAAMLCPVQVSKEEFAEGVTDLFLQSETALEDLSKGQPKHRKRKGSSKRY
ncbi:hypothetical protein PoB_000085600 [Plakobranchus ocellatus]|uniref:Uncharacterized protein n=1 Tax=Plakobranchus ocellatus TaxID=259542 RepID=A0AAV3XWB5_9GAST|nr:hypothetical protein PoB_000085600 [Plakobranchus ocellatus]